MRGAATLALALALAACGREPVRDPRPTRSLATPDGEVLVVPLSPRRIVSTLPGITESVAYLDGSVARLAAVSPHCDEPPAVRTLPKVSVLPISFEALASHDPDLVLVDATLLRVALPELRRRFRGVVALRSASLDELGRSMDLLAEVIGTDGAKERAARFREDLSAARREVAGAAGERRKVLLLGQSEPLTVLGPGSLLDDMLRACDGENVAADLGRASGPFAMERVRAAAPQWILTTEGPFPGVLRRAWADLPAVREGRVADASADDLVRAGPRIPAALRRLGRVLRGEIPPDSLTVRR